jgi:hypothetical protein
MKKAFLFAIAACAAFAADGAPVAAQCPYFLCQTEFNFYYQLDTHKFFYWGQPGSIHCNGTPAGHGTCHGGDALGTCSEHGTCSEGLSILELDKILKAKDYGLLAALIHDPTTGVVQLKGGVGLRSSCSDQLIAAFPLDRSTMSRQAMAFDPATESLRLLTDYAYENTLVVAKLWANRTRVFGEVMV